MNALQKVLVITGPTATGKTAAAVHLAKRYGGELLSVDSRQVYTGLNIGTGKDLPYSGYIPEEVLDFTDAQLSHRVPVYRLDGIRLWLYDIVPPSRRYSAGEYGRLAQLVLRVLHGQNVLPIAVGGSGFYLRSLLGEVPTAAIPPNPELRAVLSGDSVTQLQERLKLLDPQAFAALNASDRMNPRRLIRRVELLSQGEIPDRPGESYAFDTCIVVLWAGNATLKARITARVRERIRAGLLTEIEGLLQQGYAWESPGLQTLGYREWQPWFDALPAERSSELKARITGEWIADEYHYAKRQMTWMRKLPAAHMCNIEDPDWQNKLDAIVQAWYTRGQ